MDDDLPPGLERRGGRIGFDRAYALTVAIWFRLQAEHLTRMAEGIKAHRRAVGSKALEIDTRGIERKKALLLELMLDIDNTWNCLDWKLAEQWVMNLLGRAHGDSAGDNQASDPVGNG